MKNLYLFIVVLLMPNTYAQIINFPDAVFKAKLLAASPSNTIAGIVTSSISYVKIDTNNDGEIDQNEAALITKLDISASGISDLTGINYFINVNTLNCSDNILQQLNIQSLSLLQRLNCENNQLQFLDLPEFSPAIDRDMFLNCNNNLLANIDLTSFNRFSELSLNNNQLVTIDLGIKEIQSLNLSNNPITSFNYIACTTCYIENFIMESAFIENFNYDASQAAAPTNLWLNGNNLNIVAYYVPDLDGTYTTQTCNISGPIGILELSGSFSILNLNDITSETIDLSQCTVNLLSLSGSQTKYLNLKDGYDSDSIDLFNSGNSLICLC